MPSVAPRSCRPSSWRGAQPVQRSARTKRSPAPSWRAVARISAQARSAVASVNTPGVLVARMLRCVQAARSMLSKPTAKLATTRNWSPAASSSSSSIFSLNMAITALASATRRSSSARSGGSSWSMTSTSRPACWSNSTAGGGTRRVMTTLCTCHLERRVVRSWKSTAQEQWHTESLLTIRWSLFQDCGNDS